MLAVNWLLNYSLMSSYDSLTLNVLVHLLLGTPSSVLHKKLVESQLGQGGLSDEVRGAPSAPSPSASPPSPPP